MKNRLIILLLGISTIASAQQYQSCTSVLEENRSFNDKLFIAFPEQRENPILWFDSLSVTQVEKIRKPGLFSVTAAPGELFVFQTGVWAVAGDVKDLQISFSDFIDKGGKNISSYKLTCYNNGGLDFKGRQFVKKIAVAEGRVQALWVGVDLGGVEPGTYKGVVTLGAEKEQQRIPVQLNVEGTDVVNHGYDEGRRLARLNWLNSGAGIDNAIPKGYAPVKVSGKTIRILGRAMTIDDTGLPSEIQTFFTAANQELNTKGEPLLNKAFQFIIEKENGEIIKLKPGGLHFNDVTEAAAEWSVLNTSPEVDLACIAKMEFDGFANYQLLVMPKKNISIKDIRLEILVSKKKAVYMMGLNHEGGKRIPDWKWKWDTVKNQDALWIGDVNGGFRLKWKSSNYTRPLVNIYYKFSPLEMPPSWANEGNGGVNVTDGANGVSLVAYSGKRTLQNGDILHYDFEMLVTPFKLIDKETRYNDRYYQGGGRNSGVKIADAKKAGANIINIHQADDIYPYINYPYLDDNITELTSLVNTAHKEGMRMKVYYTTRELTKNLPEFWALNSLNGEVIFPGPGNASRTEALHPYGPAKWLIANLREKYIPAWYDTIKYGKFKGEVDLSVITTPDSRLNNFYIGGLDWMLKNLKIDGVYIDDCALDRFTLLRARKLIDRYRPNGKIDLHSWNHFNAWAGYANCLNLYMDLLPFIDQVWIGEARNYDRKPDHWLIEVSGIPFGICGQMLEGGGNPWRGMVYGITTRAGWTINPPTELWKFWDAYEFRKKNFIGYWENTNPVTTDNPQIKVSLYKDSANLVIAVANWSDREEITRLDIDWNKTGIKQNEAVVQIPEIKDYQNAQLDIMLSKLKVPAKKGFLIVISNKGN